MWVISASFMLGALQTQSSDSSSCSSFLLFVTAAHTRLSAPSQPFLSFPACSKALVCQGYLPTFPAGCLPGCWSRAGTAVPGAPPAGAPWRRRGAAPRPEPGPGLAGILEPLLFQADTFSFRETHRVPCRSSCLVLLVPSASQRFGRNRHTKRGNTQKCRYCCYYVDREAAGNQNCFKK